MRKVAGTIAFTGLSGRGAEGLLWLARQPLMMRATQSGRENWLQSFIATRTPHRKDAHALIGRSRIDTLKALKMLRVTNTYKLNGGLGGTMRFFNRRKRGSVVRLNPAVRCDI